MLATSVPGVIVSMVGTDVLFAMALFCLAIVTTWVMLTRVRIMDIPNERSAHTQPVPKSGGIAVVFTFLVGLVTLTAVNGPPRIGQRHVLGLAVSTLAIAVVSFYDDVKNKPFMVKLLTQLVAVLIVLGSGIVIDEISLPVLGPVTLGPVGYVVSFLWIMGLTNTFNFMDGTDALAAGVAAIASLFFLVITYGLGSSFVYINSYSVLAGALGFLLFNFPPARIFLGDVGSASLGFILATLAIIGARYDESHTSFMVMPLLLFTFIYDTVFTFLRRWLARERVTQAHRSHLYQLCHRLGWSQWRVALFHYATAAILGLLAFWMVGIPGSNRALVFVPVLAFHVAYSVVVVRAAQRVGLLSVRPAPSSVGAGIADDSAALR